MSTTTRAAEASLRGARTLGKRLMWSLGYDVRRLTAPQWADFSADQRALYAEVRPFTQTSPERVVTLADAVEYVVRRNIPGDFVECGVWMGGSVMVIARTLLRLGVRDRRIWLYDTFGAMPQPEGQERELNRDFAGELPPERISDVPHGGYLPQIRANVESTGYPPELLSYVCGLVEETIPGTAPPAIALLRLDTDWYSSTVHELEHLYPRLADRGVLIVDDYGHFQGARKAVDEYLVTAPILLTRVDYTGRMGVKG